jgi:hypothetical protein
MKIAAPWIHGRYELGINPTTRIVILFFFLGKRVVMLCRRNSENLPSRNN